MYHSRVHSLTLNRNLSPGIFKVLTKPSTSEPLIVKPGPLKVGGHAKALEDIFNTNKAKGKLLDEVSISTSLIAEASKSQQTDRVEKHRDPVIAATNSLLNHYHDPENKEIAGKWSPV